jgi:maltose O-acetyltransferase
MLGANVQIYTPSHPLSPEARNGLSGAEWAKSIRIGDDCWIGGGVIIVPGVTIGNGVTIGAGSVVTKDIPDRVVAVGNPARVIKKINADGSTENVPRS